MKSAFFPSPALAGDDGLVLVGGKLSVPWLLDAYRHGIFPWPHYVPHPVLWWSPNPRAILPLDGFHASRRLRRRLRAGAFTATCDQAFREVMLGCARGKGRRGGTWLFPSMIEAYVELHRRGHAHSVEIWSDGQLVGGVYGVAIGGLFAAESMFHRVTDASKAALAHLVSHLNARGYLLLDIQQWTPHTGSLGAVEISRNEYLRRLAVAAEAPVSFGAALAPLALPE
jgi:leucyl/phenylalanyl-tRNA--protein transferase